MKKTFKKLAAMVLAMTLCLTMGVFSFAAETPQPSASEVQVGQDVPMPRAAVVDDITKPAQEKKTNLVPGAIEIDREGASLPTAGVLDIYPEKMTRGQGYPTQVHNWGDGSYSGSISGMSGNLYTNCYYVPSSIGKLWVITDFQCDVLKPDGYTYTINCYDYNTKRIVTSWSGHTSAYGDSDTTWVSFYNLDKNKTYFFEFVNTQGYGAISGSFTVDLQNS